MADLLLSVGLFMEKYNSLIIRKKCKNNCFFNLICRFNCVFLCIIIKDMIKVEQHILDYIKNNDRRNTLLYNNRCFLIYINPSDEIKTQYEVNRAFILDHFDNEVK